MSGGRKPSRGVVVCALAAGVLAAAGGRGASAADRVRAADDYANPSFTAPLSAGLDRFYARAFPDAQREFERALEIAPGNTFAISFLCAAAAQQPGALETLTNNAEDALAGAPKNYASHVRLGFAYLFEAGAGRDRLQDARDEFAAAVASDPDEAAAHVGLGIMRFNERSSNRAKTELLLALRTDPDNVLAREYLGQLYQSDLHDPQRGLSYVIDVPNLVPRYADIDFHIGSLLADLHEPDGALGYLERGVALDAQHVGEAGQHGYTLIARIYLDEHRLPEARRELERAVAADADAVYARTLLAKIAGGDYASPAPAGRNLRP